MRHFDVFNGDADGICALHQLRLAEPADAQLVTGLKRDIELLESVPAGDGDVVTVLDISLDRNFRALMALLGRGARVRYFDHHQAGNIPDHANLEAVIDASGMLCTSALVDRHLEGRFRAWAVVGAFGDNFDDEAIDLSSPLHLDAHRLMELRELGNALNYNAYGESEADVMIPPAELYRIVSRFESPFELFATEPVVARLVKERRADLARALEARPLRSLPAADAFLLPDEPWSRRINGSFANRLALVEPQRAHAVITPRPGGGYVVSVRTPHGKGPSAAEFCHRFPTGGGRAVAAGIDRLAPERLQVFLDAFSHAFQS
ncbi:MAG: DHH family phosphoesterase [Usitatibacter sp.]